MRRMQPQRSPLGRPLRTQLKPLARAIAAAGLLASPLWLQAAPPANNALPTGLQVTAGQASVLTQGNQMTVRNSNGAILNWSSFNIGAAAGVYFDQANAASKVLNRVTGNDPTQIFGSLASNGQVWLLNPNGVLFGQGARVDVASLVTSTLRLNDNDFLAGRYRFTGDAGSTATVRNEGSIRSAHGGQVVLLGAQVENTGSVEAPGGNVTVAAASRVELVDTGLPNLAVRVDVPEGETLNLGRLVADGGTVDVFGAIVNQNGLVQADTLSADAQGRITLKASGTLMLGTGSVTQARGTAEGSSGGNVDLLGTNVGLAGTATVDVSGTAAGGGIRLGGGLQGQDKSVPNAQAVWFGPDAVLRADATGDTGSGGRIILWSDAATRAYGTLSARGGRVSGAGGFVETSGGWLDARPAQVDVSSRSGQAGNWLLDPNDILITSTGSDTNVIQQGFNFTTSNDSSIITTATLTTFLNSGVPITVSTGSGGSNTQAGDILMDNATLSLGANLPTTLTLIAARDVVIRNSTILSNTRALSLNVIAAGSGQGAIEIINSNITTAGGNITLGGANSVALPLPDGTFTQPIGAATGYVVGSNPASVTTSAGLIGVNVENAVLNLGAGTFKAAGTSPTIAQPGTRIGSAANTTAIINAADIQLFGLNPGTGTGGTEAGLLVLGQGTALNATQGMSLTGAGKSGVEISQGARLALLAASGSGASLNITGFSSTGNAVEFQADDFRHGLAGTGTRVTVSNAALNITADSTANAALVAVNDNNAPGPLFDLAAATSATFRVNRSATNADWGAYGLGIANVELILPTAGATLFTADLGVALIQNVMTLGGSAASLSFSGQAVGLQNQLMVGSGSTVDFATTGATPQGVQLLNTTLITGNGDVRFGAVQNVNSSVLGNTTTPARWVEYAGSSATPALSLNGSTLDAGTGTITGGGANRSSTASGGTEIFQSNLTAREIRLSGRSDTEIGLLVDGSTLFAERVLKLDGLSAGTAANGGRGLWVYLGSTLQVSDAASTAGSEMSLTGKNIGGQVGIELNGGDAGTANETRLIVSGAALNMSGDGPVAGGAGIVMTGTSAVPGGMLINALGATSVTIDGSTSTGAGGGLKLQYVNVLGAQATGSAPMVLRSSGKQVNGAPAVFIDNSTITTGGTLTLEGDGLIVSSSGLTGENGLFLRSNAAATTSPIQIDQSILSTSAANAQLRVESTSGGAAVGDASFLSGTGVVISDSGLQSTGAGGSIVVNGRGAATGGTGVSFIRSPFSADSISITGTGVVDGHGIFSENFGGGLLSSLTARNLTLTGVSANNATAPDKVGVRLSNGSSIVLTGRGTATLSGDTAVLGGTAVGQTFSASGDAASFSVDTVDSMQVRNASLDFSAGSGTTIRLNADSDRSGGGRVRVQASTVKSGGGDITLNGEGVRRSATGIIQNSTVLDGAVGLFLIGSTLDAGSGTFTATGKAPADGSVQGSNAGSSGVVAQGANSVSARVIRIAGDGGDYGRGVDVGITAAGASLALQANDIGITGKGTGIDPATSQTYAGVQVNSNVTNNWTVLNPGTGLNTAPLSVTSTAGPMELTGVNANTGRFTATAPGAITLEGSNVTAADSMTVTATGAPINGNALLLRSGTYTAGGAVNLTGTATSAGVGVSLQLGTALSGSSVSLNGTGVGTVGVALADNVGTSSVSATSGALSITGRSDTAQGVGMAGGWTLSSPGTLAIDSNNGLLQLTGSTSGLGQTFSAGQALNLSIDAPAGLTIGSGFPLDSAAFSAAIAGMGAGTTTTLRVTGNPNTVALRGNLVAPGRLVLQADGVELQSGALQGNGTGDAVVVGGTSASGVNFLINTAGASALSAPNGRWVLLATDPRQTALGGLANAFTAYGLAAQPWATDAQGNYITPAAGNALGYSISTAALNGQGLSGLLTKVYDASTAITLNPSTWTLSGLASGDVLSFTGSNTGTLASKNVGTGLAVNTSASTFSVQDAGGRPVFGYGTPSFTANVTPLAVTLTGTTVANKVYDGNATGSFSSLGSVTPLSGDSLAVGGSATASFNNKNVGTAKTVAVGGFALTGADAGNYTLVAPSSLTADITPLALVVTGVAAQSRVYDTTPFATLSGSAAISPVTGDLVSLVGTPSASFANKNVGTLKPVTVSGYNITGPDAGNYTLAQPAGLTADITAASVTLAGLTAQSKVYDATASATFSGTASVTPLAGDNLALAGTAAGSFANKNVGTAKTVTLTGLTLTGADAANYTLATPAYTANITPLAVNLTGTTVANKVYDGNASATFGSLGSVTPLAGDNLAVGGAPTALFSNKAVGTGKAVAVSGFALTGTDAGNYTLVAPTTLAANITPLALTVTGVTAQSKVYDTTTTATLAGSASITPVSGDAVTLGGTAAATFANKNVGTGKAVTVTGYSLSGADAGNYTLAQPAGLTASITPATVNLNGLTAQSKVYDTTTTAGFVGTASVTPLAGDVLTLAGTTAGQFNNKNAGTAKPVTLTGLSLAGADAANYTLVVPGYTANIAPASLGLLNVAAAGKTYDGTRTATMSGTLTGVLPGDTVNLGLTGQFASANVGAAQTVTWTASTTGADAANYLLAPAIGAVQASITPATLTYTASPVVGTVGQTLPVLTGTLSGFVGTDTQASATTGTLSWTTAATVASAVGQYAVTGGGLSALNYVFAQAAGNATALTLQSPTTADAATTTTNVVVTAALVSVQLPVTMSTPTQGRVLDVTTAFAPAGSAGDGIAFRASSINTGDASRPAAAAAAPGPAPATGTTPVANAPGATPANAPATAPAATAANAPANTTSPAPGADPAPVAGTAGAASSSPAAPAVPLTVEQGIAVALRSANEAADGIAYRPLDLSRLPRDEVQSLLAARARYKQKVFSKGVYRLQQDPTLADVRACRSEAELDTGACIVTEQLKQEIQSAKARAAQMSAPRAERARRGVKVAALPVIQRKLALIVGINKYKDGNIPELMGSIPDARAVRQILDTRMGYETTVLENASREQIVRAFNKLALEAEAEDSVIIYYAGHGVLVPVDGVETGYWLPSDVDSEAPATWLSNADIARLVAAVSAKQVMLVSDSCYSGQLVGKDRVQLSNSRDAGELLKRRAAVVMSSGGDEPVADTGREGHSVFAWHFMRALEGLDQWQVGGSLYERVRAGVVKDFPQTPQYGASRGAGHQGNTDYLFERRELESLKP